MVVTVIRMVARVIGMALAIMGLVKMVAIVIVMVNGHVILIHGVACENSLSPHSFFSHHSTLFLSVVLLSSVLPSPCRLSGAMVVIVPAT